MNILIYDIEISGHHSEYISHIVNYICENTTNNLFTFIVNPKFSLTFPAIAEKIKKNSNIQLIEISQIEYLLTKNRNRIKNSINEFKLMDKYAKNYEMQKVYLLSLNSFQLVLSFFHTNYEISGILFSPFFRIERNWLMGKLKFFRKYCQTWFLLRNKSLKRIFILNDNKTTEFLNERFKTNKFQMLPDPVPLLAPLKNFSIREKFNISFERKILLHFGSLTKRKGTLELLSSIDYLNSSDKKKIALFIIGKASVNFDELIINKIQSIQQQNPDIFLIYNNKFISESMMKSYFEQCDLVLIPYKNGDASSGIIGHSIASKKPVIATNKGLLGDLVKENNLGLLIEESTPNSISKAIHTFIKKPLQININNEYLNAHSPMIFAKTILNTKPLLIENP